MLRAHGTVRIVGMAFLASLSTGCSGTTQESKPAAVVRTSNERAFDLVKRVQDEPQFRDSRYYLETFDVISVTDPDLKELIALQKRVCDFVLKLGIERGHDFSLIRVVLDTNYSTLAATLLEKGIAKVPAEATKIAEEGVTLRNSMDRYEMAMQAVTQRYQPTTTQRVR